MTGRSWLLGGSLVVALALPIGCSDDGHLLGERSSSGGSGGSGAPTGGSSGANVGGTNVGGTNVGGANAGGTNAGGTNTGGAAGSAAGGDGGSAGANGATGSGGTASGTGGNAGDSGGASGTANGGGGAATGGAGDGGSGMGKPCADQTCAASEACVASRTIGGAITFPGDGGMCPGGSHVENQYCRANFTYRCVAQPGCPAGGISCSCATCPSPYNSCRAPAASQWLDTDAELVCEQLAP